MSTRRPKAPQQLTVLAADPAWSFDDALPGETRGAEKQYPCMSVEDICAMNPMPPECSANSVLFLWRVSAMVEEAYRVARAWGYVPKAELVWEKTTQGKLGKNGEREQPKDWFGMGRYVRNAHETCIIAVRGRAKPAVANIRSRFTAPVREHSRKPEEFYQIVETLYPDAMRFELFARTPRAGWIQQHGNQLGMFHIEVAE